MDGRLTVNKNQLVSLTCVHNTQNNISRNCFLFIQNACTSMCKTNGKEKRYTVDGHSIILVNRNQMNNELTQDCIMN